MSRLVAIAATFAACGLLAGCGGPTYTYRYKLTLEVEVDGQLKRGFSVVQMSEYTVSFPHSGVRAATTGEATYVDLGPGRRPLIALLNQREGTSILPYGAPLRKVYGGTYEWVGDRNPGLAAQIRNRGAREISVDDLPDLVTFPDVNDPRTVMAVDPKDLEATLGPGVKWHRMTIEFTDEPVTTGLELKLPWLKTIGTNYLSGRRTSRGDTLAHKLQVWDFKSGDR